MPDAGAESCCLPSGLDWLNAILWRFCPRSSVPPPPSTYRHAGTNHLAFWSYSLKWLQRTAQSTSFWREPRHGLLLGLPSRLSQITFGLDLARLLHGCGFREHSVCSGALGGRIITELRSALSGSLQVPTSGPHPLPRRPVPLHTHPHAAMTLSPCLPAGPTHALTRTTNSAALRPCQ